MVFSKRTKESRNSRVKEERIRYKKTVNYMPALKDLDRSLKLT